LRRDGRLRMRTEKRQWVAMASYRAMTCARARDRLCARVHMRESL
jgi:hypothetical protein